MNDYFMMGLVLAIFVITYFYRQEKKKSFALQVELDLLKVRRSINELDKQLATPMPVRPVMPQLFRDSEGNVFVGAPPRGSDSDNGEGPQ